jgi:hypothetical protein
MVRKEGREEIRKGGRTLRKEDGDCPFATPHPTKGSGRQEGRKEGRNARAHGIGDGRGGCGHGAGLLVPPVPVFDVALPA